MLQLIQHLDRDKVTPIVLLPGKGELSDILDTLNVKWLAYSIPGFKLPNMLKLLRVIRALKQLCRTNNIDLIHADHDKHMFALTYVAKALNIPTVYHARVSSHRKYDRLLARRVNHIVAISKGVLPRFSEVPAHRMSVIFNGYDPEVCFPTNNGSPVFFESFLAGSKHCSVFVFAGQLKREKGVFDILDALALLPTRVQDTVRVVFCGKESLPGGEQEILQHCINCGVDHLCTFVGQRPDVAEFFRNATAVLFPSHEGAEGMGRVPFEAMACGAPVIGTNISGVNEVVTHDTGIVVEEQHPKQLADAMELLANNPELRKQLSSKAQKWAQNTFTIDRHVEQMTSLFERLQRTS